MNDILTALGISDITPVLLIAGVALLLINIVYGVVRTARGNLRAGWFTIGLALVACAFIGVGSARSAMATAAFNPARSSGFGNRSVSSPTPLPVSGNGSAGNTDTVPVIAVSNAAYTDPTANGATSRPTAPPTNTPFAVALAPTFTPNAGDTGAAVATQTATSTAMPAASATRARGGTRGTGTPGAAVPGAAGQANSPSGQNSGQGSGASGQGGASSGSSSAGNSARTGSGTAGGAPQTDQNALQIAVFGGILSVVLALGLFFFERRRDGFAPTDSRGLLNAGASLFAVIAVVVIPMLPGQLTQAQSPGAGSARSASAFARSAITATPSPLPTQTQTATALPSLTPTMTDTPLPTATEISYAAAQPTATPTATLTECTVTVNSDVNLRADPSTANSPILVFKATTTLPVSGETKDKQWWQIIYDNNGKTVSGWVSAQVAKSNGKCTAVPVIQPTP